MCGVSSTLNNFKHPFLVFDWYSWRMRTLKFLQNPISVVDVQADHSREYCNNQGVLYAGDQACTCFDCFVGATCAEAQSDAECVIQAESGTPLVFGEFPRFSLNFIPSVSRRFE